MKSLTIHNIEPEVGNAIEQIAQHTGLSQNKVIKRLLRKALGLEETKPARQDFSAFCGLWSEEEAMLFEEAIRPFEQIDEELWK